MLRNDGTQACIVGIGASRFGRRLPESQLGLGAVAFKAALADSGLSRDDVDGLSINLGSPLGLDYDHVAQAFGLDVRYVNQSWMHGRWVTHSLQHAALAVEAGLADVVACVTAISFTRALPVLGGVDNEDNREIGGTHGESPPYGLTAPSSGAALGMQRYMHVHGATSEQLAAVPVAFRKHARLNPNALMREPMTVEDHQASRFIVEPLHLLSRLRELDQRIGVRFAIAIDSQRCGMSGKSPVSASEDQRSALAVLAGSRDRGEADRARAILLTLSGWTSPRIAEAFSVREDTVRLWRSDFSRGSIDALKASVAPGPLPVKSETALRVVAPLLEEPVANRPNWTIARMRAEIEAREGVSISRSQLSKALRKKSSVTGGQGTR